MAAFHFAHLAGFHRPLTVMFLLVGMATVGTSSAAEYHIRYVNPDAPAAAPLKITGYSYDDYVPDTLDIADRARLSIHALTVPLDREADYEPYFFVKLMRNPPRMFHDWSDWCATKYYESLPLMRLITGSEFNSQVDQAWQNALMRSIGPDGLYYIPLDGHPWGRTNVAFGPTVFRANGSTTTIDDPSVVHIMHPMSLCRVIGTLAIYSSCDKDPRWRTLTQRMVDRCLQLMVDKGDYGYLPQGFYEPNAKITNPPDAPTGLVALEGYGRLIQGLAQFYRVTRYEPARILGEKLIHGIRYHSKTFDAEGRFLVGNETGASDAEVDAGGPHFHAHSFAVLSMVEFAMATSDRELLAYANQSYLWARRQGSATVGFFPEYIRPNYPSAETCEVADMITLALKLTRAGAGDYWDDADRWVRNQLAESQLTKVEWLAPEIPHLPLNPLPPYSTTERVIERNLGAFAGWPTANQWMNTNTLAAFGIMQCCTVNGARALYYVYENILDEEDGGLLPKN